MSVHMQVDQDKLSDFCLRWKIVKLSFFGSILRDDFRPDSDIDVLIAFALDAYWGLFDMARMQNELQDILGRNVDLVSQRAVESSRNFIRRRAILSSAEVVYAA